MSARRTPGQKIAKEIVPDEDTLGQYTPVEKTLEVTVPEETALKKKTSKKEPSKNKPVEKASPDRSNNGTPESAQDSLPSVAELAQLAASLANKLPDGQEETHAVLVRSALSLWQAARDCLIEEKQRDEKQRPEGVPERLARLTTLLTKIGGSNLAKRLKDINQCGNGSALSWAEAEELIFPHLATAERREALAQLVTQELSGKSSIWKHPMFHLGDHEDFVENLKMKPAFQNQEIRSFEIEGFDISAAVALAEDWAQKEANQKFSALRAIPRQQQPRENT